MKTNTADPKLRYFTDEECKNLIGKTVRIVNDVCYHAMAKGTIRIIESYKPMQIDDNKQLYKVLVKYNNKKPFGDVNQVYLTKFDFILLTKDDDYDLI